MSVNLAPNLGANPAGLYYTAVFHLSDGTVHTEYWVVPASPTATIAQVRAQVMPAAQAVQAVSKTYVDEAIAQLQGSLLTANGGTLTGPLTLAGDPTTPLMAADKHYVDEVFAEGLSAGGGAIAGPPGCGVGETGVYSPLAGNDAGDAAGDADDGGGGRRSDDDPTDICRDGHLFEYERNSCGGFARWRRPAA